MNPGYETSPAFTKQSVIPCASPIAPRYEDRFMNIDDGNINIKEGKDNQGVPEFGVGNNDLVFDGNVASNAEFDPSEVVMGQPVGMGAPQQR